MTALDLWATSAASLAGSMIAIRAQMLRPHQTAWTKAPACVWLSLSVLALALLTRAVQLGFGAHSTAGEALQLTALAFTACAMLWNLNRHGRQQAADKAAFLREADLAMEISQQVRPIPSYHLNAPKGDLGRGEGR